MNYIFILLTLFILFALSIWFQMFLQELEDKRVKYKKFNRKAKSYPGSPPLDLSKQANVYPVLVPGQVYDAAGNMYFHAGGKDIYL